MAVRENKVAGSSILINSALILCTTYQLNLLATGHTPQNLQYEQKKNLLLCALIFTVVPSLLCKYLQGKFPFPSCRGLVPLGATWAAGLTPYPSVRQWPSEWHFFQDRGQGRTDVRGEQNLCLGPIAVGLDLLIRRHLQCGSLEWDQGPRSQLMNVWGLQLGTSKPMSGLS